MKLSEFLEKFNQAPLSIDEIAEEAKKVEDDTWLRQAAEEFIRADEHFRTELRARGFEFG